MSFWSRAIKRCWTTTAAAIRARRQVNVRTISADLSSDAAVCKVAAEAGEIDILVNNAGAIPPGDLLTVDDATWRKAWDLKVFGFISLCRAVYPQMKARAVGRDHQRDRRGGENSSRQPTSPAPRATPR